MSGPATPSAGRPPPDQRPQSQPPQPPPRRFPLAELVRGARATQLLLLAISAVFVAMAATGSAGSLRTLHRFGALFAVESDPEGWWRVVTSAFVHFSVGHLLLNLFGIAIFGSEVERRHGAAGFLAVFVAAVAAGSGMTLALNDGPLVAAGASGGVFGFMGAWLAFLIWEPHRRRAQQAMSMAIFIVVALAMGFGDARIGNAAHAGGAAGGFVIAGALEARRRLRIS